MLGQKTIPQLDQLPEVSDITDSSMLVIDTGLHTFKVLWSQIMQKINSGSASIPVGTISAFAGDVAPDGYLLCHGQEVPRGSYAALFDIIGTRFGQGDGSTTFNLPDFRGLFLRGRADGSINDPDRASRLEMRIGGATGDNVGSIQGHAFQTHTHGQNSHSHGKGSLAVSRYNGAPNTTTPSSYVGVLANANIYYNSNSANAPMGSTSISGSVDSVQATNQVTGSTGSTAQPSTSETRPVNAYVNYIIKL